MNFASLHRGPDNEIRITVSVPVAHGDWELSQIPLDRRTVMALVEDGIRMIREDEDKERNKDRK